MPIMYEPNHKYPDGACKHPERPSPNQFEVGTVWQCPECDCDFVVGGRIVGNKWVVWTPGVLFANQEAPDGTSATHNADTEAARKRRHSTGKPPHKGTASL